MHLEYLSVPVTLQADPALYYSREGQCIILDGPRGWLLAHYFGTEAPDAQRNVFMTTYEVNYIAFEGSRAPAERKSTIKAWAMPVPTHADNRMPIYSGAVGSLNGATSHSVSRVELKPASPLPSGLDADGIRLDLGSMDAHFNGSGFAIDKNGVRLDGVLELNAVTSRGITTTSPLFGVVPKPAVTFFVADFAPAVQKLQDYTIWIARIVRVTDAIYRITNLILNQIDAEWAKRTTNALQHFEERVERTVDNTANAARRASGGLL